jgi:predicted phosphodiesterase
MSNNNFQFQIFSDLHLEIPLTLSRMPQIEPQSNVCCLLGDISTIPKITAYDSLLQSLSPHYQRILVVLGNHEFYHETYTNARAFWNNYFNDYVPNTLQIHNVTLLDVDIFDVPGTNVRFIGTTLWTDIDPAADEDIQKHVADYKVIHLGENKQTSKQKLSPDFVRNEHLSQLNWIKEQLEIAKLDQKRVVLLTHHAPTVEQTRSTEITDDRYSSAFLGEILRGKIQQNYGDIIDCVCFGHTHHNVDIVLKDDENDNRSIRVVSNQLGAFMKGARIGFNPAKVISI